MISKEKAISIAKSKMPEKGFTVTHVALDKNIWYISLEKKGRGFLVELDAKTGKIVGGAGGAP